MFVILDMEYFDESISDSKVIGYFSTEDNAESYLLKHGYTKYRAGFLFDDDEDDHFVFEKVNENEYISFIAYINKLEEIS